MNFMHLHPMLVHFPIALAIVALFFDVLAYYFKQEWLRKAAVSLCVMAALGAIVSVVSGYAFTKPVAGLAATIKDTHVLYALISTVILALAAVAGTFGLLRYAQSRCMRYIFTLCLLAAAIGISLTGMKGGSIVYDVWLF